MDPAVRRMSICTSKKLQNMQRNRMRKPCAGHEEPNSSSESILALSSSFPLVRILDGTQINFGDHKKTTNVWDHGPDPGYVPSEVRWVEVVQAGMERGRRNPGDKYDGIRLSPVREYFKKQMKQILPSSLTFRSQYMFCSSFQCKSKSRFINHRISEDGQLPESYLRYCPRWMLRDR